MRDQQGFTDFATARAGDLRRQAYLLTGSPERAVRLADKALAETGRRWDRLGGVVAAEEHARRVVATGSLRGRGVTPAVALTSRGTAAPTDDAGEAVRRALAGLPPRRRAVLVLRYDEGLDDAAVGARLGLPPAQAAAEGEAGLVTLRSLLRRRGRPEDLLPTALAETPLPIPLSPPSHPSGPAADAEPGRSDADPDAPAAPIASEDAEVGASAGNSVAPTARPATAPVPPAPPAGDVPAGDVPAGDVAATDVPAPDAPGAGGGAAGGRPGPVGAGSTSGSTARKTGAPARNAGVGDGAGPAPASEKGGGAGSGNAGGPQPKPAEGTAQKAGSTAQKPGGRPGQKAGAAAQKNGAAQKTGPATKTGAASRNGAAATSRPVGVAGAGSAQTGSATTRPAGRRRWLIAAVIVVVVGIGAALLVPALRGDSTPDGPVPAATGSGHDQLPWTVRGPLAGDEDLLRSALRAWQSGVPERQRPTRAAALWAGDLDGVRTVLLQGTDATGQTWVAHVIGSGETASLRSTEPLGRTVPLLAIGTSGGAARLLADPDTPPNGILAGIGDSFRPLAVAQDSLTQGVTVPSAGLQVVLTDDGAVVRSGTVLPGRVSPVTGTVELTRPTLDLGPAQPPVPAWYDDGQLIGRRLGGPVELVQAGPVRSASIGVNGRATKVELRGYEVVRGGTRYLATVVRSGGAPTCTDTAIVGPADSVPAKPVALVARCIPRGSAGGVLAAVGTRGVRSVLVTLAPGTPAAPGRPGVPPRPAQPARTVTVTGASGSGLVALTAVSRMPTNAASAVARDDGNHQLGRVTLPAYKAPRP
jgi:DNA-directed RNA polymerase specialized sigma24 family protein